MVAGIERFREYFAAHEEQYAIIGGAACDLLFGTAGLDFRATRNIDVVLCVEVVDVAFARAFEAFLDAGGYQARERSGGTREFYRFHRPTDPSFPYMIELFSRRPGILDLPQGAVLTPIPVEDDVIRLSAILLDDSYYEALHSARQKLEGVAIIDETLLIPLKARAFLDLTAHSHAGHRSTARTSGSSATIWCSGQPRRGGRSSPLGLWADMTWRDASTLVAGGAHRGPTLQPAPSRVVAA